MTVKLNLSFFRCGSLCVIKILRNSCKTLAIVVSPAETEWKSLSRTKIWGPVEQQYSIIISKRAYSYPEREWVLSPCVENMLTLIGCWGANERDVEYSTIKWYGRDHKMLPIDLCVASLVSLFWGVVYYTNTERFWLRSVGVCEAATQTAKLRQAKDLTHCRTDWPAAVLSCSKISKAP